MISGTIQASPIKLCTVIVLLNPIQYGLFLKHYGMGGALWPPPIVTLVFLNVEGQNSVAWGILMCFL